MQKLLNVIHRFDVAQVMSKYLANACNFLRLKEIEYVGPNHKQSRFSDSVTRIGLFQIVGKRHSKTSVSAASILKGIK